MLRALTRHRGTDIPAGAEDALTAGVCRTLLALLDYLDWDTQLVYTGLVGVLLDGDPPQAGGRPVSERARRSCGPHLVPLFRLLERLFDGGEAALAQALCGNFYGIMGDVAIVLASPRSPPEDGTWCGRLVACFRRLFVVLTRSGDRRNDFIAHGGFGALLAFVEVRRHDAWVATMVPPMLRLLLHDADGRRAFRALNGPAHRFVPHKRTGANERWLALASGGSHEAAALNHMRCDRAVRSRRRLFFVGKEAE